MIEKTSPTLATLFVRLCSHGGVAARDRGGSAFMFPAHNAGRPEYRIHGTLLRGLCSQVRSSRILGPIGKSKSRDAAEVLDPTPLPNKAARDSLLAFEKVLGRIEHAPV
jgi:hypothetical protein